MRYNYIFWDWNGTLIDDCKASMDAVNLMLRRRGGQDIDIEEYRKRIDIPIVKFYEKTFDMSNENMDDLAVEFNADYRACLQTEPLREGARELLAALSTAGVKQYIFSSSANEIISGFLEKHGIREYFDAVLGSGDYYVGSKLDRTVSFMRDNGIDPEKSLFVGDMEHDREVASACGSDCVFITGGHRPDEALRSAGGMVVDTLGELLGIIL